MMTGTYAYGYLAPSGSVYWSEWERVETYKEKNTTILLICPSCKTPYLLNLSTQNTLVKLSCESCGGGLEFVK